MNCATCNKPIGDKAVMRGGVLYCSSPCITPTELEPRKFVTVVKRSKRSQVRRGPSETEISKSASNFLAGLGVYHTRLQSGSLPVVNKYGQSHYMKLCTTGTPDRMFADGLIVFLEVKRQGEDRTPEQVEVAERLRANGALVFTIDGFGQAELIAMELRKRGERVRQVGEYLRGIQDEIDAVLQAAKEN